MSKQLKIYCTNIREYVDIAGGESLKDIFERLRDRIDIEPICARVNNKTEDMHYPVFSPKQVEFLDSRSASGNRVYIRSLCMMLYKALADLSHGVRLRIEPSISLGYYCRMLGDITVSDDVVTALNNRMT